MYRAEAGVKLRRWGRNAVGLFVGPKTKNRQCLKGTAELAIRHFYCTVNLTVVECVVTLAPFTVKV